MSVSTFLLLGLRFGIKTKHSIGVRWVWVDVYIIQECCKNVQISYFLYLCTTSPRNTFNT